jgi:hypothetical protein
LPSISPSTLADLAGIFRPEVEALESQLGRNLEYWKSAAIYQKKEIPEEELAARQIAQTECSPS